MSSSVIADHSKDPVPPAAAAAPTIPQAKNTSKTWEDMRKMHPGLPATIPRPTRSVECNSMVYINGAGVERQIWMPKGTARTAFKYMRNQDWDALGKWPVWNNQKYADEGEAEEEERRTWEWLVDGMTEQKKRE